MPPAFGRGRTWEVNSNSIWMQLNRNWFLCLNSSWTGFVTHYASTWQLDWSHHPSLAALRHLASSGPPGGLRCARHGGWRRRRGDLVSIKTWFQRDGRIAFERNWVIRNASTGDQLGSATRCAGVPLPRSSPRPPRAHRVRGAWAPAGIRGSQANCHGRMTYPKGLNPCSLRTLCVPQGSKLAALIWACLPPRANLPAVNAAGAPLCTTLVPAWELSQASIVCRETLAAACAVAGAAPGSWWTHRRGGRHASQMPCWTNWPPSPPTNPSTPTPPPPPLPSPPPRVLPRFALPVYTVLRPLPSATAHECRLLCCMLHKLATFSPDQSKCSTRSPQRAGCTVGEPPSLPGSGRWQQIPGSQTVQWAARWIKQPAGVSQEAPQPGATGQCQHRDGRTLLSRAAAAATALQAPPAGRALNRPAAWKHAQPDRLVLDFWSPGEGGGFSGFPPPDLTRSPLRRWLGQCWRAFKRVRRHVLPDPECKLKLPNFPMPAEVTPHACTTRARRHLRGASSLSTAHSAARHTL